MMTSFIVSAIVLMAKVGTMLQRMAVGFVVLVVAAYFLEKKLTNSN